MQASHDIDRDMDMGGLVFLASHKPINQLTANGIFGWTGNDGAIEVVQRRAAPPRRPVKEIDMRVESASLFSTIGSSSHACMHTAAHQNLARQHSRRLHCMAGISNDQLCGPVCCCYGMIYLELYPVHTARRVIG